MPRPKKAPPLSRDEQQRIDYLLNDPGTEESRAELRAVRDQMLARAEGGDKKAKRFAELLVKSYVGHPDALISYMATLATKRRGGRRPKVSDEELRNAWARLRRKRPNATMPDLAKMLAFEKIGSFDPDYLRRRLNRLPQL